MTLDPAPAAQQACTLTDKASGNSQWLSDIPWWMPAALCLGISLIALGDMSLWDPDEPRYADAARRMVATGDFIVPYFNDEYRFQKPVLTYWLVAAAQAMFGDTAFAARFFSAIFTALAVLATTLWGNRVFGRPAGVVAGTMLALCPMVAVLARMCCPDAPQFGLGTVCFALLWLTHREFGFQSLTASRWAALGFWFALALATLAKGPIIAGMIAVTLACYWGLTGEAPTVFRLRWLVGPLLAALIAAPWFIAIYLIVGSAFFGEAVGTQLASRFTVSFAGGWLPPGFYLVSMIALFAPWSAVSGLALWEFRSRWRVAGPMAYSIAWLFGPMLLIEMFRAKQAHYFLPSYPAIALIMGAYLAELIRGERVWTGQWLQVACRWCWAAQNVAACIVLVVLALVLAPTEVARVLLLAAGVMLFAGVIFGAYLRNVGASNWPVLLPTQAGLVACVWLLVWAVAGPMVEKHRLAIPVGETLARMHQQGTDPILMHRKISPAVKYYSGIAMDSNPTPDGFAADVSRLESPVITLLSQQDYDGLVPYLGDRLQVEHSWYGWLKVKREPIYIVRVLPPSPAISFPEFPLPAQLSDASSPESKLPR